MHAYNPCAAGLNAMSYAIVKCIVKLLYAASKAKTNLCEMILVNLTKAKSECVLFVIFLPK